MLLLIIPILGTKRRDGVTPTFGDRLQENLQAINIELNPGIYSVLKKSLPWKLQPEQVKLMSVQVAGNQG